METGAWCLRDPGMGVAEREEGPGVGRVQLERDFGMLPGGQLAHWTLLIQTGTALRTWAAPHTAAPSVV